MGLRINTNISSLNALRNLHLSDRAQARSLERLASGLRINRGADDPSGLVVSERLRAQIAALQQSSVNSQNAANLISTADSALSQVNDLLIEVQGSVQFALNTGGASPDQIAAEQDTVDQAMAAIDRLAITTRYGDRSLLNGAAGYQLGGSIGTMTGLIGGAQVAFHDIHIRSVSFPGGVASRTLTLEVNVDPQRAEIVLNDPSVAGAPATLRITGSKGAADVTFGVGSTAADIAAGINSVSQQTGVFAASGVIAGAADVILRSEGFGADELISIQGIDGTLTSPTVQTRNDAGVLVAATASPNVGIGEVVNDRGLDAHVLLNGFDFTAQGLDFNINTPDFSFSFTLNRDLFHPTAPPFGVLPTLPAATDQASLVINRSGLEFQLREGTTTADRLALGIENIAPTALGFEEHRDVLTEAATAFTATLQRGGFLSSIRSGQGNDLSQNAVNAQVIVNAAAAQVASLRGFLGATVAFNVEPNIDSIDVAVENLSASVSSIRDLDFAEETANFTRTQILFQSGIAALASARLIPQAVLQLLG